MTLRLFVPGPLALGEPFALDAGAARHVQVRRLQPGEALVLFDGRGGEWQAVVTAMRRSGVQVRLTAPVDVDRELRLHVTLAVGVPANERMDWLIEKATELGVACIRPLQCERSVLRLEGDRAARKLAHWQAIAVAAAQQSGRTRLPVVEPVRSWHEALALDDSTATRWMLAPGAAVAPVHPPPSARIVVLSGPEGGATPAEEAAAVAEGYQAVHLGPRVLRAETAPLALLAWLGIVKLSPQAP